MGLWTGTPGPFHEQCFSLRTRLKIGAVVLVLGVAISCAYRLGTPTLTEQQIEAIAAQDAQRQGPGSVITQAVRSSTGQPFRYFRTSGCLFPGLPAVLCPGRSIWVVRVHTPGRNYDLFYDATTGQSAGEM